MISGSQTRCETSALCACLVFAALVHEARLQMPGKA